MAGVMGAEGGESTWDQALRQLRQRGKVTRSLTAQSCCQFKRFIEKDRACAIYRKRGYTQNTDTAHTIINCGQHDWEKPRI